jgi:transcriptional antiterminator NusG
MAMRWYIVQAYSNFERKVAEDIRQKVAQKKLDALFEDVIVPTEKVVEMRRGRKVDAERKFFPGYVLVKMDMTNEAFHLIKNTPKVTGFLGSGDKPMPISEKEAMAILQQVQEGVDHPKPSVSFEVGEQVRVSDGPFASFNGARASRWKFRFSGDPLRSSSNTVRSRRSDFYSGVSRGTCGRDGGQPGCLPARTTASSRRVTPATELKDVTWQRKSPAT